MSVLLLLAALASAPAADDVATPPAATAPAAPVRLSLNNDRRFISGDRAKVRVEANDDGYVWVLQVDTDGRLRVLFPLDPSDDNYVRGGRTYELRGRGNREAFVADGPDGQGFVYAAWQRQPFDFTAFTLNDHWDYRALAPQALAEDPEAELNDLVSRADGLRWEYDLLAYDVSERGRGADVVVAPVLVNSYFAQPVGFYGGSYFRGGLYGGYGWCDAYWYGSVACDPFGVYGPYGSFVGINVGGIGFGVGSWGYPYGRRFYDPFWRGGYYYGGFNRGWGGYGGYGYDRGWYGHGWNRGGGGYLGPRNLPPRITNYDLKNRNRTWGRDGLAFGDIRSDRYRTGTTVAGPAPTRVVRDLDRTRGVGRRPDPILIGDGVVDRERAVPVRQRSNPAADRNRPQADEPRFGRGDRDATPGRGRPGREWSGAGRNESSTGRAPRPEVDAGRPAPDRADEAGRPVRDRTWEPRARPEPQRSPVGRSAEPERAPQRWVAPGRARDDRTAGGRAPERRAEPQRFPERRAMPQRVPERRVEPQRAPARRVEPQRVPPRREAPQRAPERRMESPRAPERRMEPRQAPSPPRSAPERQAPRQREWRGTRN